MLKVIVIDDDHLVTQALTTIIEADSQLTVSACGYSSQAAIHLYEQIQPDVLLLDIRLPDQLGLTAAQTILQKYPRAKILLLTTFSDNEYISQALAIGVKGYLIKQNFTSIVPAIHAVANNQYIYGDEIVSKIQHQLPHIPSKLKATHESLTKRQQEILQLVAAGKNNKEIAQTLFLSEGTIRNQISQLLTKLQLRDRTQLAIYYYQNY